ncbi:hypothetical protein B0H16DRAFT_1462305 [Mycena metata]|uniref:Uncharacterized protein n=1 Tax=Mycena metata TaxID=1033252 RepID=A0AAD7IQH9_9AGAR|nr:hypothetical protein B0H16DRAFT_1462305 [Mycena metata]
MSEGRRFGTVFAWVPMRNGACTRRREVKRSEGDARRDEARPGDDVIDTRSGRDDSAYLRQREAKRWQSDPSRVGPRSEDDVISIRKLGLARGASGVPDLVRGTERVPSTTGEWTRGDSDEPKGADQYWVTSPEVPVKLSTVGWDRGTGSKIVMIWLWRGRPIGGQDEEGGQMWPNRGGEH